jgi:hypothetical protein
VTPAPHSICPGVILIPLAKEEMSGPGTTDEVAAAYLLDADFVTGSDLIIDGGVIAAMHAGRLGLSQCHLDQPGSGTPRLGQASIHGRDGHTNRPRYPNVTSGGSRQPRAGTT